MRKPAIAAAVVILAIAGSACGSSKSNGNVGTGGQTATTMDPHMPGMVMGGTTAPANPTTTTGK